MNKQTKNSKNRDSNSSILRQPYPSLLDQKKYNWLIVVSISLFVSLFLLLFQPFGLSRATMPNKILFLAGYGGITFVSLVILLILAPKIFTSFFSFERWTVGKHILWLVIILFGIGIGNFLYSVFYIDHFIWNWKIFLLFQAFTLLIGIFPIAIVTLISFNIRLRNNLKEASGLNQSIKGKRSEDSSKEKIIKLKGKNKDEYFSLSSENLLYIVSEGNYVQIYYLEDSETKQKMLRNTIGNIKDQTKNVEFIVQCHRAFLVNIKKITESRGNAQGFTLSLEKSSSSIPVSRKFVPTIKEKLSQ
jgi:hypothetical protein